MNLTREEILAAPVGRELDNLVASRVMGYKFPTFEEMKETAEEQWKDQPSCIHFFRGFDAWLENGEFKWKYNSKSYSTDISAAMEVEAKTAEKDIWSKVAYVEFLRKAQGWNENFVGSEIMYSLIHATPEQRCKAALLTVLEGQTHEA